MYSRDRWRYIEKGGTTSIGYGNEPNKNTKLNK